MHIPTRFLIAILIIASVVAIPLAGGADDANDTFPLIGGDQGYYRVHSDVDGATVFLDTIQEGVTSGGYLDVQVYVTGTPFRTYTVRKAGYVPFTADITQYPAKDETVDLFANLTPLPHFTRELQSGWNLLSTPVLLDNWSDTISSIFTPEDRAEIDMILKYNDSGWFVVGDEDPLMPLEAFYVDVVGSAPVTANFFPSPFASGPPERDLPAGMSLIGPAPAFDNGTFPDTPVEEALASIREGTNGGIGYVIGISPALDQPGWAYPRGGVSQVMMPFHGYWVVMDNPGTLKGGSATPVS
jgi:hypothetical protein